MEFSLLHQSKDAELAADAEFMTQSLYKMLDVHADEIVVNALKILADAQDASQVITQILPSLSEAQTENLITAVGMFAQILNIAEDVHHQRRRLVHEHAGNVASEGNIAETVKKFQANDLDKPTVQAALNYNAKWTLCCSHCGKPAKHAISKSP